MLKSKGPVKRKPSKVEERRINHDDHDLLPRIMVNSKLLVSGWMSTFQGKDRVVMLLCCASLADSPTHGPACAVAASSA